LVFGSAQPDLKRGTEPAKGPTTLSDSLERDEVRLIRFGIPKSG
jgi:hypothetical protein